MAIAVLSERLAPLIMDRPFARVIAGPDLPPAPFDSPAASPQEFH
jgi:hypothetical protein